MSKRRGNCYVTCEALYHLLGGKAAGWKPYSAKHEGDTHWWLEKPLPGSGMSMMSDGSSGIVPQQIVRLDPTVSQFRKAPDYSKGRARGFLTKLPSKRARALMETLVWQKVG